MPWLPAQLNSLSAQQHENWSLWVSDDGSTDGTLDCLREFAKRNPTRLVRLLRGPEKGSAANYLSLLCHPDLPSGPVALCDQDDVWLSEKLARAVEALEQEPAQRPAVWVSRYFFCDASLQHRRLSDEWPREPSFGNALVQNILSGHTITLNAAALNVLRQAGPQAVPHHDWWIYMLMTAAEAKIISDPQPLLLYRQHGANLVGARQGISARLSRLFRLMGGEFGDWNCSNLSALRTVLKNENSIISPSAYNVIVDWASTSKMARIACIGRHGIRRQSRGETLALALALLCGRF